MENKDGSLAFKATLDIDDFNVSAEAMERHIKKVSSTTDRNRKVRSVQDSSCSFLQWI